MAHIRVIHDPAGETLTIYWDDPHREEVCEEVNEELVLIKDSTGKLIGLEKMFYRPSAGKQAVTVETVEAAV